MPGGQCRRQQAATVAATASLRMADIIGGGTLSKARALIRRESAACG
jgi:hypothetical protein